MNTDSNDQTIELPRGPEMMDDDQEDFEGGIEVQCTIESTSNVSNQLIRLFFDLTNNTPFTKCVHRLNWK